MRLLLALFLFPLAALAQQPHQQEIQRALIQLDQRTSDFARGTTSPPLTPEAGRPLHPDPEIAQQLRPYERMRMAEQHELRLPPPVGLDKVKPPEPDSRPLPLPGGPRHGVDPIPVPGRPN